MVLASTIEQNDGESPLAAAVGNTLQRVIQRHSAWGQVTDPMFPMAPRRRRSASAPVPQSRDTPEWMQSDPEGSPAEGAANEGSVRSSFEDEVE